MPVNSPLVSISSMTLQTSDFTDLDLVAWRVEQGTPGDNNPLLEPKRPWDEGGIFSHGTVLRNPIDGLWKAWQISTPIFKRHGPGTWRHDRRLNYLESKDGVTWTRPGRQTNQIPSCHSSTSAS